jgi:hypothetical protein
MAEKEITLRNIYYFLDEKYNFFIPDYQRGYRWKDTQVENLLDDLYSFYENNNSSDNKDEFYCLQPVVVKKNNDIQKNEDLEGNWFEVIDGQQRLTTIYLILHYLNNIDNNRDINFSLDYETRLNFVDHIDDLTSLDKSKKYEDNIDYFNIHKAYQCINNWFEDKKEEFNAENFKESVVLKKAKFIWYQVEQDVESIDIFTRINIGKIPLTNAELIKALFLGEVKAREESDMRNKEVELKRLEIAKEWDQIEYTLQNDQFWYFIYSGDEDYDTRIEYIFDLIQEKEEKDEDYYTFYEFNKELDKNSIDDVWLKIKQYFQKLNDWYNNRLTYHYIGYLVNEGESIDVIIEASKLKTKIEFEDYLIKKIKSTIEIKGNKTIENLEYGIDNRIIKKILLLFNIQTLLEHDDSRSRFPFDLYKNQNWDLEHIHSIQEEMPQKKNHQKEWLKEVEEYLPDKPNGDLAEEIEDFNGSNRNMNFENLYNKILGAFNNKDSSKTDHETFSINDISNLTLLDPQTNRGYGNAPFPVKRKTIIKKDRTERFIPVCTKNVFLKYYSDDVKHVEYWNEKDSEDYLVEIKETLTDFIDSESDAESENNGD